MAIRVASIARGYGILVAMLRGAGASPKSESRWRSNPQGTAPRTLAEALAIGRRNGVPVDDELFRWRIGRAVEFGSGELATYIELRTLRDDMVIPRDRFLTRDERYAVALNPSILSSDDAILAVLIHETHEIAALEERFARSDEMSVRELRSLIDPQVGKLHCEAWDEADRRVIALIEEDRRP